MDSPAVLNRLGRVRPRASEPEASEVGYGATAGDRVSGIVAQSRGGPSSPRGAAQSRADSTRSGASSQEWSGWVGTINLRPTREEIRISARLLIHIANAPRPEPDDLPPESLTQTGMAKSLGVSQGAVSNALGRLVAGGLVQVERARIRGRLYRAKVYHLTLQGEELVRRIREGAGLQPGEVF